jgi:hypothetical protein
MIAYTLAQLSKGLPLSPAAPFDDDVFPEVGTQAAKGEFLRAVHLAEQFPGLKRKKRHRTATGRKIILLAEQRKAAATKKPGPGSKEYPENGTDFEKHYFLRHGENY